MATEGFKGQLTSLFGANVVPHGRLMSADEASAVRILSTYREITDSLIKEDRSRVVEPYSENVLARVANRVDVVNAHWRCRHCGLGSGSSTGGL